MGQEEAEAPSAEDHMPEGKLIVLRCIIKSSEIMDLWALTQFNLVYHEASNDETTWFILF